MSAPAVLVVDDLDEVRIFIAGELRDLGFEVLEAADGETAWVLFGRHRPALVVTDLVMPKVDGFELLRRIRRTSTVPVLMLTAQADIRTAVRATRMGASEFLTMPEGVDELCSMVTGLLDSGTSHAANPSEFASEVVGRSAAMRRVRSQMRGVSPLLELPVLVWGEPGTGRQHVVRAIHAASSLADRPLVVAERGTLPKGADLRAGGAVYFPSLAALSHDDQRFVVRVFTGNEEGPSSDLPRLFASTTEPLAAEVSAGRVTASLAQLFNRASIELPPLKARRTDIKDLAVHFCARIGDAFGRADVRVSDAGVARLRGHAWPGNVRELYGLLEKLIVFAGPSNIDVRAIEDALGERGCLVSAARQQKTRSQEVELSELLKETGGNLAEAARRLGLSRSTVHYRARKFGLLAPR
jgi:two-component system nitrogen regulation response regulator NtrX